MAEGVMQRLQAVAGFCKANEPLAAYTHLKLGGPAEVLAEPRSKEELAALVKCCTAAQIPVHILGRGSNVLVRDEGIDGVVLRLSQPAFTQVEVNEDRLRVGSGAALSEVIAESA
jgi:UDP-N-acetylmuramate dehydrogenase